MSMKRLLKGAIAEKFRLLGVVSFISTSSFLAPLLFFLYFVLWDELRWISDMTSSLNDNDRFSPLNGSLP